MGGCFLATLYAGYTGLQWRRLRELGVELGVAKKAAKAAGSPSAATTEEVAAPATLVAAMSAADAEVASLQETRETIKSGNFAASTTRWARCSSPSASPWPSRARERHMRAGKLWAPVYAGVAVASLWAVAARVPEMQKGKDWARSGHIGANALTFALFAYYRMRRASRSQRSSKTRAAANSMEYLGLADAPAVYDVSGVRVEEISVSFSDNKPLLYGPCPFALSCAVLRSGNRDIAPPATERTVAQLEALASALAVTSPGASRRRGPEAGREHPDALGSLGAKRKQDVEADEARVLELERVVDAAGDRFAGEARAFVAAFPAAFSEVVNAAVDDMMAAAAGVAEALDIAKTEIRVSGGDDCDIPAPPPGRPQGVSTGGDAPSWHTDDAPTQEPPPPAPSSAGPSWADGMDDKAEAAAAAPDAPW
ncbi:DUF4079-containing protein [Aureococcus anophagefferens]|nr:DUF4079-containing protein [Aureococcus anophagefferens]